nr:twin-arginine translocation pathway signal protein [Sandarakinorhabdus sp.]
MTGFATTRLDRRQLLAGAAAAIALPATAAIPKPPAAAAQKKIRAAIDRQLPENIARIQDWIRNPGIAAENYRMEEACAYTMGLLKDAGFQSCKKMPTR